MTVGRWYACCSQCIFKQKQLAAYFTQFVTALIHYRTENVFFKIFWRTHVLFVGPLIPLFWTSGNVCPGFQSQGGSLACMQPYLCTRDSTESPLVQHLPTSWWPAWQPVGFPTCYICSRGRMLGFDRETSCTVSRHAIHWATATGLRTENVWYHCHTVQWKSFWMNVNVTKLVGNLNLPYTVTGIIIPHRKTIRSNWQWN